jgi:uncharacterized protein YjiS (DUF1127 family)
MHAKLIALPTLHVFPFAARHRLTTVLTTLQQRLQAVHAGFRRWREERQTCYALSALDARGLKDLAVSRGEIPYLAGSHPPRRCWSGE